MKKKISVLLMTFLLTVSSVMPVCAAESAATLTGFCQFNSSKSVTAGAAMDGQIVMIISKAFGANGNNIGSGGNTGRSSTTTNYSTSSDITYTENTYSAPEVGLSFTTKDYR